MKASFIIAGKVRKFPGAGGWYFIQASKKLSQKLREIKKKSFGSLHVQATLGKTVWKTSLFPAKKNGPYMIAIKVDIRKIEKIVVGKKVNVSINIK